MRRPIPVRAGVMPLVRSSAGGYAAIAALATLCVHLVVNAHYGFFRDELYFIICGRHPDWGYVDQPPLVPLMAAASQLFGHSLFLLRAVPAVFAALGVSVAVMLAAAFGGGRFAQTLAALTVLFTGVLLIFGAKVSTDEVGLLTWPLIALLLVRLVQGADRRIWIAIGAAAGITVQSKDSIIFLLIALILGMLLTPERRLFRDRWFAMGCAVTVAIALPNFVWQWQHDFPMVELLRNSQNGKNIIAGPLLFLAQQLLITTPFIAPVWIIGLVWLLREPRVRFLGFAYAIIIVEMLVFHGKHYYAANIYPILIAAGAVQIELWTERFAPTRVAIAAYVVLAGIVFAPFAVPVLPETAFVNYAAAVDDALHIPRSALATEHNRDVSPLPGDWADMHGWPELASTVQRVYASLPAAERSRAVVLAGNYGEAAALNFFTPDVPVISSHNQYWLWGTHGYDGTVLVQIGGTCFRAMHIYAQRTVVTTFSSRWGIAEEQGVPIAICRNTRATLAALWPEAKNYN